MATGSTFPIFIRPELQDGALAFAEFKRLAGTASKQAADSFKADFNEVTSVISNALTKGVQGGKLNLDVSQLRQASADAKLFGAALTDTLRTAQLLAKETGDTSAETRQFILAIETASKAQDENRRGIDAQIATYTRLQAGLDATLSSNSRLAQSYRETYAEAAKMAQLELANGKLGSLIAPALGGAATSRGAGYSALAELSRQQDETEKLARASEQLALELDVLRRAEVGVAEGAKIVEGVYRGTAAAIDATTISARESAAVFEQLFAAQAEVSGRRFESFVAPAASTSAMSNGAGYAELEKAARAADEYERQLAELRQQVDPLAFEQARVNREMAFAADAYRRGDITADQLTARNQQLTSSLSQMRGGLRETRQGMIQVGQQMQDVTISLISGQRAGTVLAQQLPQLAFAMSNFGGKVGAAATFLSSGFLPSIALVAGSFGLGLLIDSLIGSGDAADKAKNKFVDLTSATERQKAASEDLRKAIDEYNKSQEQQNKVTQYGIQLALAAADASLKQAIAKRELLAVNLREEQDRVDYFQRTQGGNVDASLAQSANNAIAENEANIARLQNEITNRTIELGGYAAKALDPLDAIRIKYDDIADAANRAARAGGGIAYGAPIADVQKEIERRRRAEEAGARDRLKSERSTAAPPVTLREVTSLISSQLGGQITSTTGGRHVKGSYHYSGQGVDFVPKGGMGSLTKAQIREAFGAQGIELKELLGPGDKGHSDHFHVAFAKRRKSVEQVQDAMQRMEEASARAAEKLQRDISASAEAVSQLRGQFDKAPRDIDRAAAAVIDLNDAITEIDKKLKAGGLSDAQRKVLEETKKQAVETRDVVIPEFERRPLTRELSGSKEQIEAQRLLLQGRNAEYDVMADSLELARLLGAESLDQLDTQIEQRGITKEMVDAYYKQRRELRLQSIEIQNQQEQTQILLGIVEDIQSATKSAIYDLFDGKGLGAAKNFFNSLYDITKKQMTEEIYEQVFGDMFRKEKLKILGLDQVDETGKAMASAIRVTIDPIKDLGNAAAQAAAQLRGSSIAANDNAKIDKISSSLPGLGGKAGGKTAGGAIDMLDGDIVVNGYRSTDNIGGELKKLNKTAAEGFGKNGALAKSLGGVGEVLSSAMKGAAVGEMTSGILKSLGVKQSKLGAQIGGAAGSFLPIPGGEIIGSIIGGTIGGLFKKSKQGFATIGGGADGQLAITGTGGNSSSRIQAGNQAAGATIDTLAQIAQALGGTYDASKGSVSIGRSGDSWHVDTTGRGRLKKSQGGLDFDDDYEAAVRAATMDLIKDGVISGLRASTQRLLQQGKDIDSALQKALDFESVFTRLKEYRDPVGAALDTLDKEFMRLKGVFAEAGASAAEYADLEALYGLEREQAIKEAGERVTASLKSLFDDLTIGDNGRSLRDRLGAAQAAYDPLKARVLAGDKTAYDDFAEAARSLLDIQREFSGSQTPYFNLLDEITKITRDRIEAEKNVSALAADRDSPFGSNGKATGANDNAPVVSAIEEGNELLRQIGRLIAGGGGGGGGGGFGTNPFR